jgi:type III restriction enzyme
MKILLKEFQEVNVDKLVRQMRVAARDSRSGDLQSVALSSPTGSGKTAMLTAAIELLLKGDDDSGPMPDATFLWITDQPELNEQTYRKMLSTSSVLSPETLVVIDATFDRETFKPGGVHFLNTQKIGKEKSLVSSGDKRTYTIWETIENTVAAKPGKFFVIIDEAHRGMQESTRARNEATSIIQKFIKGSTGEIPAMPVIVGISATPKRFHALIEGTERTSRSVNVEPEDVRTSGLLKETITLFRPKQHQPTDMTMLRSAAKSLLTFTKQWADYCAAQGTMCVRPILVVQVQDAGATDEVSKTDMAEAIGVLSEELGSPPSDAFAHAFQEGTKVTIGDRELRYLSPSNIDEDPDVRAVFFKTSLNTGWDCPRAEVMMSFRTAVDATLIAQLVGRMVRTPLARSVVDFPLLNTVSLYLPHYDKKGLDDVISRLSSPDADLMPPVGVRDGDDVVELHRSPGKDEAFAALAAILPTSFRVRGIQARSGAF